MLFTNSQKVKMNTLKIRMKIKNICILNIGQGRRKVSDIGGSRRRKDSCEIGTYLRFYCERLWQG